MDKLFITILNHTLAASWMILAIIVLRFVFQKFINRIPKWVNCLLWGLAAIRLVFPFHIESMFSLIPSAAPVPTDIEYADAPQIDSGISVINTAINPVLENHFAAEEIASVNPVQVVIAVASYIWVVGAAVLLLYAFISFLLLKRQVKNAQIVQKGICRCGAIDTPFILGIWKPTIYIPESLEEDEYLCVMEHEKAHIKRGDFFWKPLGFIILSVYWFHPLCWIAYILLCRDIEYACDEKVTRDKDKDWKAKYCQVLLDCSSKRRLVSACPVAFGEVSVKDRIRSVISYKKPTFWVVIIAMLTVVIVAICFMTNPKTEKIDKDVIVGTYEKNIAEEDKMLYASMLSISADGTFVYNPSMISSYMGAGTWEFEDDHVIFYDTGMGDTRKEVFLYRDGNLYYIADESASNSMWQLEDGAEYVFEAEKLDLSPDALERNALSSDKSLQGDITLTNDEIREEETKTSQDEVPGDETGKTDTLEEAIHQAIIEHGSRYAPASGVSEYKAASFIILEEVLTDGTIDERYVKGMSMYMEANVSDKGIEELSVLHVPAILTFEVTDGSFLLKEYWEPGEGAYYGDSIKENFLPENAEIVMNSQATVYKQYMDCYDQIIRASGMNPDAIIEQLLSKICSLPDSSSLAADYIKNWPIEYRELIYYGQYTLDYYEEHSDQQDLQAAVLEEACTKIEEEIGGQENHSRNRQR